MFLSYNFFRDYDNEETALNSNIIYSDFFLESGTCEKFESSRNI